MTELHVRTITCHKHWLEHNFQPAQHTMQSQHYGTIWNYQYEQYHREKG